MQSVRKQLFVLFFFIIFNTQNFAPSFFFFVLRVRLKYGRLLHLKTIWKMKKMMFFAAFVIALTLCLTPENSEACMANGGAVRRGRAYRAWDAGPNCWQVYYDCADGTEYQAIECGAATYDV
jgi:energy-coupling factor transporter transmembrane protein EcfT